MAEETIYLCNFRVSVDGDWLCLKELSDVRLELQHSTSMDQGADDQFDGRLNAQPSYACSMKVMPLLHGLNRTVNGSRPDDNREGEPPERVQAAHQRTDRLLPGSRPHAG
ncbi:protein RUFY3 [Elysia marginata]|uniref:Protein RUFY3 n=1 Tax=Elysia marginata TaxID=1093978 RepID=A0AAV4E839_9GAST|nr:protein RUFY3 [Elysia marginata]